MLLVGTPNARLSVDKCGEDSHGRARWIHLMLQVRMRVADRRADAKMLARVVAVAGSTGSTAHARRLNSRAVRVQVRDVACRTPVRSFCSRHGSVSVAGPFPCLAKKGWHCVFPHPIEALTHSLRPSCSCSACMSFAPLTWRSACPVHASCSQLTSPPVADSCSCG